MASHETNAERSAWKGMWQVGRWHPIRFKESRPPRQGPTRPAPLHAEVLWTHLSEPEMWSQSSRCPCRASAGREPRTALPTRGGSGGREGTVSRTHFANRASQQVARVCVVCATGSALTLSSASVVWHKSLGLSQEGGGGGGGTGVCARGSGMGNVGAAGRWWWWCDLGCFSVGRSLPAGVGADGCWMIMRRPCWISRGWL